MHMLQLMIHEYDESWVLLGMETNSNDARPNYNDLTRFARALAIVRAYTICSWEIHQINIHNDHIFLDDINTYVS